MAVLGPRISSDASTPELHKQFESLALSAESKGILKKRNSPLEINEIHFSIDHVITYSKRFFQMTSYLLYSFHINIILSYSNSSTASSLLTSYYTHFIFYDYYSPHVN
ncbi:unnamed protein product [Caenorhabditis brenneri]